jgi:hypothetical protein
MTSLSLSMSCGTAATPTHLSLEDPYPTRNRMREEIIEFDTDEYNGSMPWYLCNVMLIETNNGILRRIGVGVVHVNAFLQESPVWKDIVLE